MFAALQSLDDRFAGAAPASAADVATGSGNSGSVPGDSSGLDVPTQRQQTALSHNRPPVVHMLPIPDASNWQQEAERRQEAEQRQTGGSNASDAMHAGRNAEEAVSAAEHPCERHCICPGLP